MLILRVLWEAYLSLTLAISGMAFSLRTLADSELTDSDLQSWFWDPKILLVYKCCLEVFFLAENTIYMHIYLCLHILYSLCYISKSPTVQEVFHLSAWQSGACVFLQDFSKFRITFKLDLSVRDNLRTCVLCSK